MEGADATSENISPRTFRDQTRVVVTGTDVARYLAWNKAFMTNHQNRLNALFQNLEKVILGKRDVLELAVITLLSRGHLLLEDVPGLGKTMLARAIAGSLGLRFKRIQCTPDLLPSDVTGISIYNQKQGEFEFRPGPVFTHILLADEINRTTPRTQSSLLECMEEGQVTVDGTTHPLPTIFMVMATQNPIESQGTYPLPEAQMDRFFMKIKMGYPSLNHEIKILAMQVKEHPIHSLTPVISEGDLAVLQETVKEIYIEPSVTKYIVEIVEATRRHKHLLLGASPRGSLALMRASKAMALLKGIKFVDPHFVKQVAPSVLAHRLIVKPPSRLQGIHPEKVLDEILNAIPVPVQT